MRGIIPARWVLPAVPIKYDHIIITNWLEVELPAKKPMPVLEFLSHWRNRDVFNYIKSIDWTARMFEAPIKLENVRFAR